MGAPTLRDNALTTLESVKQFVGVSEYDQSKDGVLIQLINQASASVERALGRKLKRSVYTERVKGTGGQYLLLNNYPITDVEYIKQAGEIIAPGLYDYLTQGHTGIVYKDDGWAYAGYPQGLTGDYVMGSRNMEVRYTAGYLLPVDADEDHPSDLPADLEGLVLEMIQFVYGKLQTGGTAGMKSFSISDVRWEWSDETPPSWQETINQYKRVWI